jgi:hypothetical protein
MVTGTFNLAERTRATLPNFIFSNFNGEGMRSVASGTGAGGTETNRAWSLTEERRLDVGVDAN